MKTCTVCLKTFPDPSNHFHSNITCADGYNPLCKKCANAYHKYRRDKIKEHNAKGLKTLHIKKPRHLRQKFFYVPRNPLPPNPEHAISVVHTDVRVEFK